MLIVSRSKLYSTACYIIARCRWPSGTQVVVKSVAPRVYRIAKNVAPRVCRIVKNASARVFRIVKNVAPRVYRIVKNVDAHTHMSHSCSQMLYSLGVYFSRLHVFLFPK